MLPEIDYTGEGRSDEAVARKLIVAAGGIPGTSYLRPLKGTGKSSLDARLSGLNRGAAFGKPLLVLRDLDQDAPCAAALVRHLLPRRNARLLLRIAVRAVESWLLADSAAYAHHCGFARPWSVTEPETIDRPKHAILALAAQGPSSRLSRHLQAGRLRGVPDWALLGEWHSNFAATAWDPKRAAASGAAPSLARALLRLSETISGLASVGGFNP